MTQQRELQTTADGTGTDGDTTSYIWRPLTWGLTRQLYIQGAPTRNLSTLYRRIGMG